MLAVLTPAVVVVILTTILTCLLTLKFLLFNKRHSQLVSPYGNKSWRPKQPTLFLIGPQNSGKTLLWQRLSANKILPTFTSLEPNIGVSSRDPNVQIIDYPGHPKMFNATIESKKMQSVLKECKTDESIMVFVIDSTTLTQKETLESNVRLLLHTLKIVYKFKIENMVILGTKVDLFTAMSQQRLLSVLQSKLFEIIESELSQKAHINNQSLGANSLDDNEDDEDEKWRFYDWITLASNKSMKQIVFANIQDVKISLSTISLLKAQDDDVFQLFQS